ncbi:MAG: Gfo/Idh/MocA family oxidoreductase [Gemmatimonadetes bacterium]|nr:Gfo/Idh/MocA family oxidoreductase [Gemmatimonadota bacterium]
MGPKPLSVGIIGCGLIGRRRAETAAAHPGTRVTLVADTERARAEEVASKVGAIGIATDWRVLLEQPDLGAVVIATPNAFLAQIATCALERGKHVLLEKPMSRNLAEAEALASAALAAGRVLKVGFNHRYHPALARAYELVKEGAIGPVINIRARYGHGGRPGYENEWRADPLLAGGGELIDQGVHLTDLLRWFCGPACQAVGFLQTADWPIAPLEDNAFGMLRFDNGVVAQLHVSMTQWKNLFAFEVHGRAGAIYVEGLGGSYGVERLIHLRRRAQGGLPDCAEQTFAGPDVSWQAEWADFVRAVEQGSARSDWIGEALEAMRMVDALYRSASTGQVIELNAAPVGS